MSENDDYVPERDAEGHELVTDERGEKFPVAERKPGPFDGFTGEQLSKISSVYTMIAQALPVEGRDYSVKFTFKDPHGNPNVSFSAKTDIGMAFIKHVYNVLGRRAT